MKLSSGLTVKFVSMDAIENTVDLTKIDVVDDSGVSPRLLEGSKDKQAKWMLQSESFQQQHSLEHFHWKDWPDRGVPATTTLAIFRMLRKVFSDCDQF